MNGQEKGDAIRCGVSNGFIKPCANLRDAIDRDRVGIVTWANMATFKHTRNVAVLYAGKWRKQGIVMRHCPFCGEHISPHLEVAATGGRDS